MSQVDVLEQEDTQVTVVNRQKITGLRKGRWIPLN